MVIKRWAIRIHKWVALAVGLQIVLWVLGGVVMSAIPIERVHGDHNIAPQTAGALDLDGVLAPMEVAERAGVVPLRAELRDYLGRTVYVFSTIAGPVRVDARSGERLPPVTEEEARRVARADYAGDDEIAEVRFFPEPTWEYRREGPAWRVEFADPDRLLKISKDLSKRSLGPATAKKMKDAGITSIEQIANPSDADKQKLETFKSLKGFSELSAEAKKVL